jgi:hypothetical protein
MRFIVLLGAAFAMAVHAGAEVGQSVTKSVSFRACLEAIRQTASATGEVPTNIVETSTMRVVRISAADGSILVTCNGDKGTMTITPSSKRCGVDVNC